MKFARKLSPLVTKTVMRDAHCPERIVIKTESDEVPVLERNKRIREAGVLMQDSRSPFADGDVIAFSFQFPTIFDYEMARSQHPELFERASKGGDESIRAGQRLAILYPQYVTITKRGDAARTRGRSYGW